MVIATTSTEHFLREVDLLDSFRFSLMINNSICSYLTIFRDKHCLALLQFIWAIEFYSKFP